MRKTEIDPETLELLYAAHYAEAVHSFKITCDKFPDCENILECCQRCLIPKLRYVSLSSNNREIERIIADLLDLWPVDEVRPN